MRRAGSRWVCAALRLCLSGLVGGGAALALAPARSAQAAEPAAASVRRVALLVGANDGGQDRELLRFANSDAEAFGRVLGELGGLERGDRVRLEDPSVAAIEQAFADLAARVRRAQASGERVQFVFYYSGHSDESGLLLEGVRLDYKRLRKLVDAVPADVRIAILDSCSSGAFTRQKGGKKTAPFLVGAAAEVAGHAYLSSSAADEVAQESDRIGGSFFTHYLVTGLRGAADVDGDRRVTLNEAYRFAFDETLARTETTAGGPQHAAYDIGLAGTGDLVMTDLRKTSATLVIAAELSGRVYVRDRRGQLAAELFKPKDAGEMVLALEPGDYSVTLDDGRNLHRAAVEVRANKRAPLALVGLEQVPLEGTRTRGEGPTPRDRGSRPPPPPGGYLEVPGNVGLTPGAESNMGFGPSARIRNKFSLSFGATGSAAIEGGQFGLGAVWAKDYVNGAQAGGLLALSLGPLAGFQASALAAVAREQLRGVQLSGVYAGARELQGLQGAFVSHTGGGRGVQLGLVNISRGDLKGAQIGLINYAEDTDASIGLLPVTKKGGVGLDVWTSDVALVHLGLRLRARRTYAQLGFAVHPLDSVQGGGRSYSGGFGFGGALVARRTFFLDLDNTISVVNEGFTTTRAPYMLDTLRLSAAWRPAKHFGVFAALTYNFLFDFNASTTEPNSFRPGYDWSASSFSLDGFALRQWPGFALGFNF